MIVSLYSPTAVPSLGITHASTDSPAAREPRSFTIKCSGLISLKLRVLLPVFLTVTFLVMEEFAFSCVKPAFTVPKSSTAVPSSAVFSVTISAVYTGSCLAGDSADAP